MNKYIIITMIKVMIIIIVVIIMIIIIIYIYIYTHTHFLNRMQHKTPTYASAAISATRGDYLRADIKTARPALHIYSVDMLAAPAAFAR